jgi:hypothetical protein
MDNQSWMPRIHSMRPILAFVLVALAAASGFASERPTEFRLDDVTITMLEQPRWPVGFAKEIVVRTETVTVATTALPCDPCKEKKQSFSIKSEDFLALLGKLHRAAFFDASSEYTSATSYVVGSNRIVSEAKVMTTDENRVILRVRIGEWQKEVLDDGEAPLGLRELQNSIFTLARTKRQ